MRISLGNNLYQKSIVLIFVFYSLTTGDLRAQQDPLYAQYFNNPVIINPAFAGSTDRLIASLAYRSQWSGLEGRPATFNFNTHIALSENKVGAGFMIAQDRIGEFRTSQIAAIGSYKIKLNTATFSFGMQAGIVYYGTDPDGVRYLNPEPVVSQEALIRFNTGVGLLLKNDRYAIGLSVPHLLPNQAPYGDQNDRIAGQNYYLYGAYHFLINDHVQFRPSTLLRFTKGTPLSADLNLNVTFNRRYTGGVFTRNLNTYGLLLQFVLEDARFSYIYELPGGSSELNYNTHELGVAISFDVLSSHDSINNGL